MKVRKIGKAVQALALIAVIAGAALFTIKTSHVRKYLNDHIPVIQAQVPYVNPQTEHKIVGAIFAPVNGGRNFICSGALVGMDGDGNGLFLTARHCVWNNDTNEIYYGEEISFSDNMVGPYYTTSIYAISQTDDLALLKVNGTQLKSYKDVGIMENEQALQAGDAIENVAFPLGLGKMEFHGRFIAPVISHITQELTQQPGWEYTMPADITVAPGSSGSPIFDSRNHDIIGVEVGSAQYGGLSIVVPSSRVFELITHIDQNNLENFKKAHANDKPRGDIWNILKNLVASPKEIL